MESHAALRAIPFMYGLSDVEIDRLVAALRRRRFARNEVVFHRDDPGNCLYLIAKGTLKIALRYEDGREIILTLLGVGDYFGELALLDGEPRSADAIAVEPCELLLLPRDVFLRFIEESPGAALRLLEALGAQFRRLTDTVHDAAFLDVPGRLARVLQTLSKPAEGEATPAVVRVTQNDLAAMVGATRESINRWLGYYQDQGWIRRERGSVVIIDREALMHQQR